MIVWGCRANRTRPPGVGCPGPSRFHPPRFLELDPFMPQPIVVVDAFTDRPYAGNPAAVCVLERPRDDRWMQLVAREMNLSETAFLLREGVTCRFPAETRVS
jgi:hypothetical protein